MKAYSILFWSSYYKKFRKSFPSQVIRNIVAHSIAKIASKFCIASFTSETSSFEKITSHNIRLMLKFSWDFEFFSNLPLNKPHTKKLDWNTIQQFKMFWFYVFYLFWFSVRSAECLKIKQFSVFHSIFVNNSIRK